MDQKIGKYVKVGGNIAYANTIQSTFGDTNSNYSNLFMFSQNIAPIYPIYLYDTDGQLMYDEKEMSVMTLVRNITVLMLPNRTHWPWQKKISGKF